MIARLEEVATWDDEGRIEGMQFDSRERRIQQWREKKDEEEFDRLIARLRQHKNYRAWYERHKGDPGFCERMREHSRRMRAKHGGRRNAEARENRQQEAKTICNVCKECGKEFLLPFGFKKKRRSKFCSRSCRNREHARRRPPRSRKESP